jgi:hypothetical protein
VGTTCLTRGRHPDHATHGQLTAKREYLTQFDQDRGTSQVSPHVAEEACSLLGGGAVSGWQPAVNSERKRAGLFTLAEIPGLAMPAGYKCSIADWFARHLGRRAAEIAAAPASVTSGAWSRAPGAYAPGGWLARGSRQPAAYQDCGSQATEKGKKTSGDAESRCRNPGKLQVASGNA